MCPAGRSLQSRCAVQEVASRVSGRLAEVLVKHAAQTISPRVEETTASEYQFCPMTMNTARSGSRARPATPGVHPERALTELCLCLTLVQFHPPRACKWSLRQGLDRPGVTSPASWGRSFSLTISHPLRPLPLRKRFPELSPARPANPP